MTRERSQRSTRRVTKVRAMLGVSVLCAGAVLATPSGAQEKTSLPVPYGDLDLSRPEGVLKLYKRIEFAAQRVCESYASTELERHPAYLKCYSKAVDDAVRKVGSDRLTAMYLSRARPASKG
jgi:UrcA family protein